MFKRMLLALSLLFVATAANAQFAPLTTWYWQLSGTVNKTRAATIYDIDMEGASSSLVAQLKSAQHVVVCYIDAGGWEPFRSDASAFPKSVIGNKEPGWNEYFLDIRSPIVRDLMSKRMDTAKAKGCDGIEPDVMDTYTAQTGFPLTKTDEIDYAKFWSQAVHQRGMKIALKNNAELVSTLVSYFDFSIAEECFDYKECSSYAPFIKQGKAVLVAEYTSFRSAWCTKAKAAQQSLAFFNLDLNGRKYQPCP